MTEKDACSELKRAEQRSLRPVWSGGCRRRWGRAEAMALAKMGCLDIGDPVGGLDAVGDAPERARGGDRRPAVGMKRGHGARVELQPNWWEHEHH